MQGQKNVKDDVDKFFDHEQQNLFNIITARNNYKIRPFLQSDLQPDLVIQIKVPTEDVIRRGEHLNITNFVTSPPDRLQRAYKKAQKIISKSMEKDEKYKSCCNEKVYYQKSFKTIGEVVTKQVKLMNQYFQEEPLEIECVNQFENVLDMFNLGYHTFVYLLQAVCGFRVRAFMLYDEQLEHRKIYLFLNMEMDNLLRVATRFRIKKEIDYTSIDFFLNDPSGSDERQIKMNSHFKDDDFFISQLKQINRYFGVHEDTNKSMDIIEEKGVRPNEQYRFLSYIEQSQELFNYLKYNVEEDLSNEQKNYIFACNRRKINPGCQKYYARLKKRKDFFEFNKDLLAKHGFRSYNQPVIYEEFVLPGKNSKASTFFHKLEAMMLYRPHNLSPDGQLSLFLPMERIKLSYLILKSTFRVDSLQQMGFRILALSNDFEKFGSSKGKVKGSIDGESLTSKWTSYSFFTKTNAVRDYFGDSIGYHVMTMNYIIGYLSVILIPYVVMFTMERMWSAQIWLYTSQVEAALFAFSYNYFLSELRFAEDSYFDNFQDKVSSNVFLARYRGPYIRNVLTDEVNEYRQVQSFWHKVVNTICMLILIAMLVAVGGIFNGCRFLLQAIYDHLIQYSIQQVSLAHIITYSIYLSIVKVILNYLASPLINAMVYLQNPPSEQIERERRDTILIFYMTGIQLVPFFFFFIIEPFGRTSCYTDGCQDEIDFYVYSRAIISFFIAAVQAGHVIFAQYAKSKLITLFLDKKKGDNYQQKLSNLLVQAVKQAGMEQYMEDNMPAVINLHNFAILVVIFPISPAVVWMTAVVQYITLRLALLHNLRRPINRSESIIRFSKAASFIFYIGVIVNSWENIFALQFIESYMQGAIESLCNPATEQNIFLLKLAFFAINMGCLILIGLIGSLTANVLSSRRLFERKRTKLNEYLTSKGGLKLRYQKTEDMTPLRTIFRVKNPDKFSVASRPEVAEEKLEDPRGSAANLMEQQH